MANGKTQKLRNEIDEKGCYFGRTNRLWIEELRTDINGIGKKISGITYLLISSLVGMVINLLYLYLKK